MDSIEAIGDKDFLLQKLVGKKKGGGNDETFVGLANIGFSIGCMMWLGINNGHWVEV